MKPHLGVAALALLAGMLAACGGGTVSAPSGGSVIPQPSPSVISATATLSTTTTTTVTLTPISNGSSASVSLPRASAAAKATLSLQASLPSGASAPQAKTVTKAPSSIGGNNLTVLDYVALSVDAPVVISQSPGFSFSLATAPSNSAYVAFFDVSHASNGWNIVLGPGTVSGTSVSFAATTLVPSLSLVAGDTYVFALVTATGAATPSPVPPYPGGAGSTFAFSGSSTQTDTYTYPTPSPLPNTSVTSSVSENVSVGTSPFPSGSPTTNDLHSVLTIAAPLASQITTTDAWYGLVTGSAPGVALFGQTSSDNASNVMTQLYATPNTVDLLPETNGASWTNSPAGTTNATFADGETLVRADNADGSFSETTTTSTLRHAYTFVLAGNADGSGSYTGTALNAFGVVSFNASAPSNGVISVSALMEPTQAVPSPTPMVLATPKAWFTPSGKLYTEADVESTDVAYPANCNVPSSFGFSGTHISQNSERIDPMIGTDEKVAIDTYTSVVGPVCMVMQDTLTENYDYILDASLPYPFTGSPSSFADFSGNAVHVATTAQTLTLQSANLTSASRVKNVMGTLSATAMYAARGQFSLKVAALRHHAIRATIKRIEAAIGNGGLK